MNIIKKVAAMVILVLTFSNSYATYHSFNPFATGGSGSCHHHSPRIHHYHPSIRTIIRQCPCHSSANDACPFSKVAVAESNACTKFSGADALALGAFSSVVLGAGLYTYFTAKKEIENKIKIMKDFESINKKLQFLNVNNAHFLADTKALISKISDFDDEYHEILQKLYFGKTELDILLYGNLWPAEFIVELKNFQVARERLESSSHPYALEDAQKSLKKLKIMADGFYQVCKEKVAEQESNKLFGTVVAGIGAIGLAGTAYMYGNS